METNPTRPNPKIGAGRIAALCPSPEPGKRIGTCQVSILLLGDHAREDESLPPPHSATYLHTLWGLLGLGACRDPGQWQPSKWRGGWVWAQAHAPSLAQLPCLCTLWPQWVSGSVEMVAEWHLLCSDPQPPHPQTQVPLGICHLCLMGNPALLGLWNSLNQEIRHGPSLCFPSQYLITVLLKQVFSCWWALLSLFLIVFISLNFDDFCVNQITSLYEMKWSFSLIYLFIYLIELYPATSIEALGGLCCMTDMQRCVCKMEKKTSVRNESWYN